MLLVVIVFTSCGSSTKDGNEGLELTLNTKTDTYAVTGIGDCTDTDIIIPNTYMEKAVTGIGDFAFESCEKLTSITIPDSVTSIGDSAFRRCTSLTSITIDEDNVAYKSIDGNLYTKDGKTLIQYAIGKKDTSFVIPNSVTSIEKMAFYYCLNLKSITIGNNVTSIRKHAFRNCENLTSINIPNGVTSIGEFAFENCKKLTNITIPSSITSIENGIFLFCENLTSINIPNNVTSIGYNAFKGCSNLTSITIPCNMTNIGNNSFTDCTRLISITVDEDNIAYKSIDGNLYTKDGKTLIQYAIGKKDTSFVIPNSVTNIASDAFLRCTNLASVTVPSGVISIGVGAFYGCKSLTSVTIPSSVTSIGKSAFYDCKSLIIYCEASSKPNGWESTWNYSNCPVFWGHAHTYENGECVCGKTE